MDTDSQELKLSIVVMTYNRSQKLNNCLGSLLAQDFPQNEFEVLIVDDGSTDGTRNLVSVMTGQRPNLKYFYQEHSGVSKARNTGLLNAKGKIVAFIADDYILPSGYARRVVEFFQEYPKAQVVSFKVESKDGNIVSKAAYHYYEVSMRNMMCLPADAPSEGLIPKIKTAFAKLPLIKEDIDIYYNRPPSGAAAFRREVFKEVGLFDEGLKIGEDSDMGLRLKEAGIGVFYNPFVIIQQTHETKLSSVLIRYFLSGACLYSFKKKNPGHLMRLSDNIKNCLFYDINIFLNPIWRARQADSLKDFFLFLPFMFLINLAYTLGVFIGRPEDFPDAARV